MTAFECLAEYKRTAVSEGTRLALTYHSARGEASTPVTLRATVDGISDHNDHLLLWLDADYRDPTYTLALFADDSNLHYVHKPGDIRTANDTQTRVTAEVIDENV